MDEGKHTGRPLWAKGIHGFIIVLFSFQVLYAVYQVFVVLSPAGYVGPLGAMASAIPADQLMARRLYAIEGWIAGGALIVYLAITEPAFRRR